MGKPCINCIDVSKLNKKPDCFTLDSDHVIYVGPPLPCTTVLNQDTITQVIQKLSATICTLGAPQPLQKVLEAGNIAEDIGAKFISSIDPLLYTEILNNSITAYEAGSYVSMTGSSIFFSENGTTLKSESVSPNLVDLLIPTRPTGTYTIALDEEVIHKTGNEIKTGNLTVNAIIKAGGLSTEFLKADGTVDSTVYTPLTQTPLQIIDEGNGNGIIIRGRIAANYGNVGEKAVDLSFSDSASSVYGATGIYSFSSGLENESSGYGSYTEGVANTSTDVGSHAEGVETRSFGYGSHSEGTDTEASGIGAHSEGGNTTSSGAMAHSEGLNGSALGDYSHIEGQDGYVTGIAGHGEGFGAEVYGNYSHVGGFNNIANSYAEFSTGYFGTDVPGNPTTAVATDRLFNIGNGTGFGTRSNAFTLLKNGLATLPSVTNALISGASNKAIITKEYLTSFYPLDADVLHKLGNETKTGNLTVNAIIKAGGLSTEYLKADGSVSTDANIVIAATQVTAVPHVDYLVNNTVQGQLDNTETTVIDLFKVDKTDFKDLYQTGRVRIDTDVSVGSISPADTLTVTAVDNILFINEVVIDTPANKVANFLLSFGSRVFVASAANTLLPVNTRGIFYVGVDKLGTSVYRTSKVYDQDVCYIARILVNNTAGVYSIVSFKYFPDLANNRVNNRDRLTLSSGYIVPSGAASISFGNRGITYSKNSINYSNNKFDPNFLSLADSVNPAPMSFLFFLPNITSLAVNITPITVLNPTQWYNAAGAVGAGAVNPIHYQVYKLFVTVTGTIAIQTKESTSNAPQAGINAIFANKEDALAGLTSVVFPDILPAGDSIGLGTFYLRAGTAVNGSTMNDPNDFYFRPYTSTSSSSTVGVTVHDLLSGKNDNPAFQHVTTSDITNWNLKAPLNSPAFTGTPTAPTAPLGTNNTQIATTAFVFANAAIKSAFNTFTNSNTFNVTPGFSGVYIDDTRVTSGGLGGGALRINTNSGSNNTSLGITSQAAVAAFYSTNSNGGAAYLRITGTHNDHALQIDNDNTGFGNTIQLRNSGSQVLAINKIGDILAKSFARTGGTASQYLMADGSVSTLTNPITGSLTTNYIPKATGANTLGNSGVFDNNGDIVIGGSSALTGGGGAKWLTANGTTTYGGGLVSSINGVAKAYYYSDAGFARIQAWTGEGVQLFVNASVNALTALSNGNVGIGTTSPTSLLHISGLADGSNSYFKLSNSTTDLAYFGSDQPLGGSATDYSNYIYGSGKYNIWTGGSKRFTILDNGNVGVGTTNPTAKFATIDPSNTFSAVFGGNGTTPNVVALGTISDGTPSISGYQHGFAGTTNLSINIAGGNVLIGTTTDNGQKLQVAGDVALKDASYTLYTSNIAPWSGHINVNLGGSGNNFQINGGSLDARNRFSYFGTNKGYLWIDNDQFNCYYSEDADATMVMNYVGYNGSFTRFRSLDLYNGKGSRLLRADGPTGVITINNLAGTGTRTVVADASGNLSAVNGVESGFLILKSATIAIPQGPDQWVRLFQGAINDSFGTYTIDSVLTSNNSVDGFTLNIKCGYYDMTANNAQRPFVEIVHKTYNPRIQEIMVLKESINFVVYIRIRVDDSGANLYWNVNSVGAITMLNTLTAPASTIGSFIPPPSDYVRANNQGFTQLSNGNIGIGTSNPINDGGGTSKVLHLHASGVGEWSVSRYTNGSTGSSSSNGLIVGNIGVDSYLFNYANGNTIFATNATEKMRITSGGNVGIQNSNPTTTLDVTGNIRANGANLLLDYSGNPGGIQWALNPYIHTVANGGFEIKDNTNNQSRFVITSSGNVLIGTTTDTGYKLNVNGSGSFNGGITAQTSAGRPFAFGSTVSANNYGVFTRNDGGALAYMGDANGSAMSGGNVFDFAIAAPGGRIMLSTNSPILLNPFTSGNVLIGTATDNGTKLQVNGGISIPVGSGYSIGSSRFVYHDGTTYLGNIDNINPGSSTILRSGGIDVITMTSSGNVGIGTAGPSAKLAVANGNMILANTDPFILVFDSVNSKQLRIAVASSANNYIAGSAAGDGCILAQQRLLLAGGEGVNSGLIINANGTLQSVATYNNTSAGSFNVGVAADGYFYRSTSSIRYKKNVKDYEKGLKEVMSLRPVTYQSKNKREEGNIYAGFIAEEIDSLGLNEFVQYNDKKEPDAISYANMVALLTKAIQEQQIMIQELRQEINILKKRK